MSALRVVDDEYQVSALAECEAVISRVLQDSYRELGAQLKKIRDGRLYKEAGYERFEDYCRDRWDMDKSYATRTIQAADVTAALPIGTTPPSNEGQARELAKLPEDRRLDVWTQTLERTSGKPTAKAIAETYADMRPSPKKPEPLPESQRNLNKARELRDQLIALNSNVSSLLYHAEMDPEDRAEAARIVANELQAQLEMIREDFK